MIKDRKSIPASRAPGRSIPIGIDAYTDSIVPAVDTLAISNQSRNRLNWWTTSGEPLARSELSLKHQKRASETPRNEEA
jgi:hypothetical protein